MTDAHDDSDHTHDEETQEQEQPPALGVPLEYQIMQYRSMISQYASTNAELVTEVQFLRGVVAALQARVAELSPEEVVPTLPAPQDHRPRQTGKKTTRTRKPPR